jgi:monoamine oxidase
VQEFSVLIIGAGASGLAAGLALSKQRYSVGILEGRNYVGGRACTILTGKDDIPIELGAEFIHGTRNSTWPLLRRNHVATHAVPDRHWMLEAGKWREDKKFWQNLDSVMGRINPKKRDQSFASFLKEQKDLSEKSRALTLDYVEGFHAAPAERIGTRALGLAAKASEQNQETHAFRISKGYSFFFQKLERDLRKRGAEVFLRTVVRRVHWEPGMVLVEALTDSGPIEFAAPKLIITLPLGVLKHAGTASVEFDPFLAQKSRAIRDLEMGSVTKITLQFHEQIWPTRNFGFLHLDSEWFPTWWADKRGPILTAWSGGPRSEWLANETSDSIIGEAIQSVARICGRSVREVEKSLAGAYYHDWKRDPFSNGAYSFTPVGRTSAPRELGQPLANTLFFAGEATNAEGDQGTIQAAISSGFRVAREIIGGRKKVRTRVGAL